MDERDAGPRLSRSSRHLRLLFVAAALVWSGSTAGSAQAYLYWANSASGTIGRANLDGSGVNQSFISGLGTGMQNIAVDGQHIYWADGTGIGRATLDGTGVNTGFITGLTDVNGVAVDGQYVYWASRMDREIGRANLDGSGVDPSWITLPTGAAPLAVAVNSTYVYWTDVGSSFSIGKANLDGSAANDKFMSGVNFDYGLALDSQYLYAANNGFGGTGSIDRANLDGSHQQNGFVANTDGAFGVSVTASNIYWANSAGTTIGRANLDGSAVDQSFISGAATPKGVAVDLPPTSLTPPTFGGSPAQGQTLVEAHGSWTMYPTSYSYQWLRCDRSGNNCSAIGGATAQSYALGAADVGATIRVQETGGNAYGGSGQPATSAVSGTVVAVTPANVAPPTITGTAAVGSVLTEAHGSWTNSPTSYSYQWERCDGSGSNCAALGGATAQSYMVVPADAGNTIRVLEAAANPGGTSPSALSATVAVPAAACPGCGGGGGGVVRATAALVGYKVKGPTTVLAIECSGGPCSGSYALTSHEALKGRSVVAVSAKASTKTEQITVGSGGYDAPPGGQRSLTFTLNATGKRLLAQFYKLPATLTSTGPLALSRTLTFEYPRITSQVAYTWAYTPTTSQAQLLSVSPLPAGARVALLCDGSGCPFAKRIVPASHRTLNLTSALTKSRLAPGVTVTVEITAPDDVGKVVVFRIRAGAEPAVAVLCLPPGSRAPKACV